MTGEVTVDGGVGRGDGGTFGARAMEAGVRAVAPLDDGVVLDVRGLSVDYGTGPDALHAVRDVDLVLRRGQVLGIAGESGSGKSTIAYSVARILRPPGRVV